MADQSPSDQPSPASSPSTTSLPLTPGLSADITSSAPVTGPAWQALNNTTTVEATPSTGGILAAGVGFASWILVGQGSGNHMLTGGGTQNNILISGGGQNVMAAVGGATSWVHTASGPGGVDIWTDFNAGIGDKVTWHQGLAVVQSGQGTITDPALGIDTTGLVLVFSDGSKVGIPTVTDHTALDPSWILPPPPTSPPAVPTPAPPPATPVPLPTTGLQVAVDPAPQINPDYIAPLPSSDITAEGANKFGGILVGPASGSSVLLGGPGNDYLVGSPHPFFNNVLSGGGGTNTLTGSGFTTFVHSPGAIDVVTDWQNKAGGGDHITMDKSTTLDTALSGPGIIDDKQAGLSNNAGLVLVFDDHDATGAVVGHSEMVLANVAAAHPDPSWFV